MKRPLGAEDARAWAVVAATVRPFAGRAIPIVPKAPAASEPAPAHPPSTAKLASSERAAARSTAPEAIEPNRRRQIARRRDAIAARLDLHGLDQDRARALLFDFLLDAQAQGARAVLVITGKGREGDGVLRRRAPEWLADPRIRPLVAGLSWAEPHHGGEGALYVALKRKGG